MGEWRPFLKVEAKEEGCLSLQREHAAGLAALCRDDDPWGCYSCLLKDILSFPVFFPLFQSKGFVAISLPSSSEAFRHAQPEGESCVLQDVSLQLPCILHTGVSSVLSCSIKNTENHVLGNASNLMEFLWLQPPGRSISIMFYHFDFSVCVSHFQIFYDLVRQINRKTPVEKKKPKKKSCLLL